MASGARNPEPVEWNTPGIADERVSRLKELFPEAFTEGKLDFDNLRATLGDLVDDGPERYTFTWAGKRDAIRLLQMPSRATLVPCREESVEFDTTEHIFIEGDNLEVLKLLYKPYFGRVKMIYIDPPYNTGKERIYPDNYADPLATYLELTAQQDTDGNLLTSNPETSGRYHSTWLSMMYPRLFLARQLLREDGVVFVSIDDHEVHNLRLLMNEVFGEENFITQVTIQSNPRGRQSERFVASVHEYVLTYARNIEECTVRGAPLTEKQLKEFKYRDKHGRKYRFLGLRQRGAASRREDRPHMFFPVYVDPSTGKVSITLADQFSVQVLPSKSTGEDGRWMWGKTTVEKRIQEIEARIISKRGEWDIFVRDYLSSDEGQQRTRKFKTIWDDKELNYQNGKSELKALFGECPIDYPKPTFLLRQVATMADDPEGIFLDFFAGACPLSPAIFGLNREDGGKRRFICVQLPEPTAEDSVARRMAYSTISEIGKERIRRVIARMRQEDEGQLPLENREAADDLGFKVFKLAPSSFRSWTGVDEDALDAYAEQMQIFTDPLVDGWTAENVIYEVALKEGYALGCSIAPVPQISGNSVYRVTDPDKEQWFLICLDDVIDLDNLTGLKLAQDDLFICRDVALDDQTAANLALQCRLKTI